MAAVFEPVSGLKIGDPEEMLIDRSFSISLEEIDKEISTMVLSASGWRKVYAFDGDEENKTEEITDNAKILVGAQAMAFGRFLKKEIGGSDITVALGMDSRYTGPMIANIMMRVLISLGIKVRYQFIIAAPEIMSYARMDKDVDSFVYISASHNPIGHNGMKFGLDNGGVLDGGTVNGLIQDFRDICVSQEELDKIKDIITADYSNELSAIFSGVEQYKNDAYTAYSDFTDYVLTAEENRDDRKAPIEELKKGISTKGVGVIAELNGSARSLTIDREYLEALNCKVTVVNGKPREIVHRIVPEGSSLNLCKEELIKAHKEDPAYILGYVPDNDGDRGNIVYFDYDNGEAKILKAQDVFALACLAELMYLVYLGKVTYNDNGEPNEKVAVVVNGPTSMRIERIAESIGAKVFRAEVGEANVVNLARSLRDEGWIVRIMGEGSNGGNITFPAAVRDPLNTVGSFLKLLCLIGDDKKPGLFKIWCRQTKQMDLYRENFTLTDVMHTLPQFVTTDAYEDRAILKITKQDHKLLKEGYEKRFLQEWEDKKQILEDKFGITSWEGINYEGMEEKRGFGPEFRTGEEKGGFKIVFKNHDKREIGYIWMRGSGTEPVFRVLVDVEGVNAEFEEWLLNWHVSMIKYADQ